MMLFENDLNDLLGDGRKNRHHQRTDDRTEHRGRRHPRIAGRVTKNS